MSNILKATKAWTPKFIRIPAKRLLTSLATEERVFDWHRNIVGGMWEEIGRLQFEFMVGVGLKPEHYFLDVGGGCLRGGIHFIKYLEEGHYFGVDKDPDILNAGQNVELTRRGLHSKHSTLVHMEDFNFQLLDRQFDYALAQSVFTHLSLNSIIRCVMNIEKVLVRGGRFYATFFENRRGKFCLDAISHGKTVTHFDQDCYHYDFDTFKWICEGTSLAAEYIGDWNHPRDQMMMVFIKG